MRRRSGAQEKAQALRQRLVLGTGYVDIFAVLRELNFEVYRRPFHGDGLEGSLQVRDGVPFIFVNSSGAVTRQRLTAAHELGHYELGAHEEGTEVLEGPGWNNDAEEWEVFRFARHFLMDEQGTRQLVSAMTDEEQRIAAVAHRFVVSPSVAAIHLAELVLIKRSTKERVKQGFDNGSLKPSAFLARYGYAMNDLSDPAVELDPGHVQRSVRAYADGLMSLDALSEVLMMTPAEARAMLLESGIEPHTDEVSDAPQPIGV